MEEKLLEVWFQENKLSQFKDILVDNGYNELEVIAALTDSDLRDLGVNLAGHWKFFLLRTATLCKKLKLDDKEPEQGLLF